MLTGRNPNQKGITYLVLLVAVAIIGGSAAYSVRLGAEIHRRWAEKELLRIGAEFERAFASYRAARPISSALVNPRELKDLLLDRRYPSIRRHLRKLFSDPFGVKAWGVLRAADGSIIGIFSLAPGKPLNQRGFDGSQMHFNGAESYADWVFGASSHAGILRHQAVEDQLP